MDCAERYLAAERSQSALPDTNIVNPFVHHLELTTTYEKVKAGILTVLVLPARLMIIIVLLVTAWLLACIGLLGLSEEDLQSRPLSPWRRKLRWFTAKVLRGMAFFWGFHWVRVRGTKASRYRAPVFVMAPHSSFFDVLPAICLGEISVVSRTENLRLLLFGKLISFTQPVYVWREDPESRQKTIQQIVERATSELDWSQLLIFPEGTCTNRSCLITFKPGAFYPGVPVQPVILRYPNKLDTVTWTWQGPGALKLMWLTLVQPHSNCEIEFLPVYEPSEAEKRNPKLYAENVRQLMARALGIPTMDYTYDDCQLVDKANRLSVPPDCLMLKTLKYRIRLGLSYKHREQQLVKEKPEQLYHEQLVNYPQFAERLGIPTSDPILQELFSLIDEERTGTVDFTEYLLSVLMVELAHNRWEMLELAFSQLSPKERLRVHQLASVLRLVLQLPHPEALSLAQAVPTDDEGLITFDAFESFMETRPELMAPNNNNSAHKKRD